MKTLLHPKTAAQLDAVRADPQGSVIFHGKHGIGKATAARELASLLNCAGDMPTQCSNCRQIAVGNFPDFIWVHRGDKASISIELVRGLTAALSLRPYRANAVRVVVIDEAHLLTHEAQNALLKLLEEPPPATLILLLAEHPEALLLTVRSRCKSVAFGMPSERCVAAMLVETAGLPGPKAAQLAGASAGLPGTALSLAAHPAEAQALMELNGNAESVAGESLFERLLLAAKLASTGADLERFGEALHRRIIARLTAGEIDANNASGWLDALERFRIQLGAKVSARVALERLMLELD